jgi:hypothetical protein
MTTQRETLEPAKRLLSIWPLNDPGEDKDECCPCGVEARKLVHAGRRFRAEHTHHHHRIVVDGLPLILAQVRAGAAFPDGITIVSAETRPQAPHHLAWLLSGAFARSTGFGMQAWPWWVAPDAGGCGTCTSQENTSWSRWR